MISLLKMHIAKGIHDRIFRTHLLKDPIFSMLPKKAFVVKLSHVTKISDYFSIERSK